MNNLIKTSKGVALISFISGTALFLLQLIIHDQDKLPFLGLIFIVLATLVNIFFIMVLTFKLIEHPDKKEQIIKTIAVILLNLPIAILYFFLIIPTLKL